jgi:hypothetical protein
MQKCAGQVGECCLLTTVTSEAADENATKKRDGDFCFSFCNDRNDLGSIDFPPECF